MQANQQILQRGLLCHDSCTHFSGIKNLAELALNPVRLFMNTLLNNELL